MTDNFVVIHGMNSQDLANGIAQILKEFKEYKVQQEPVVISAENYTIVQIKKNLAEYQAGNLPETAAQPNWDGTVEHAPEPQKKPELPQQQQPTNNQQPQGAPIGPNGKDPMGGEEQQYGPPPSPQMQVGGGKSGKKG